MSKGATPDSFGPDVVRPDFVPVADYISRDFLARENEKLWPRVWLMACREEELAGPGAYHVFGVVRETILLVRQPEGAIKAFYNVCQHRGRKLKEGCGQIGKQIYCRYHGWSWNEAYHVEATHPQTRSSTILPSEARGIHSMFGPTRFYPVELPNRPAAIAELKRDPRELIAATFAEMHRDLQAMYLEPGVAAARRLVEELPAGTDMQTVGGKLLEFHREELEKRGVAWPEGLSPQAMEKAGFGWHLFPNFIILPAIDGSLCYRTRPDPDDPDHCIWDIWCFGRFAPGEEPTPQHTQVANYEDFFEVNRFLKDDLINLPEVQKGMYSRGFKGLRTNPVQEACVSNLHKVIHDYLEERR